jgi:Got1/Sft2-like family
MLSDNMKIGVLLVSLGFLFLGIGVVLFLDAGLMAVGNLLLLCGFPFILGFKRALTFFNPFQRKEKWKGIMLFFTGIFLVLIKHFFLFQTLIGLVLELYGLFSLFGSFLPIVLSFMGQAPVIGPFVSSSAITTAAEQLGATARRMPD